VGDLYFKLRQVGLGFVCPPLCYGIVVDMPTIHSLKFMIVVRYFGV